MKRLLLTVALAIVALPSFAAIQYDFIQKNTTDHPIRPVTDVTGRTIVDGARSRVEYIGGNTYPPGTYVLSTDGARRLLFVDPEKKSYTEFNTSGIATALSTNNLKIENFTSSVDTLPDRPKIAGVETTHYKVAMQYDVTLTVQGIALKQHVVTTIEKWTSDQFAEIDLAFYSEPTLTGNEALDKLIDTEMAKATGFPMRQIVTVRTSYDMPVRTKLNVPNTRTITRETVITAIGQTKADPSMFVLPASFRRADQPKAPDTDVKVLTFEGGEK
ncbi:MAG: hypothetical protein QOJ98_24 [Acidobacteriota bacterium]|jgi:hypothetical protein|nr:hypothetical protein [Acidobacteriota bacterium]